MKRFISLAATGAALLATLGGTAHAAYFSPYAGSYSSRYNSMYNPMYGPIVSYAMNRPYYYDPHLYQNVRHTARVINENPGTRTVIRTYFDSYGRPSYDKVTTTTSRTIPHQSTSYMPSRGYYNEYDPYDSYNSYNPWMYSNNNYWGY